MKKLPTSIIYWQVGIAASCGHTSKQFIKTLNDIITRRHFLYITCIYVSGVHELHFQSPSPRPNMQVEVESTIKVVFDKTETTNKMSLPNVTRVRAGKMTMSKVRTGMKSLHSSLLGIKRSRDIKVHKRIPITDIGTYSVLPNP